MKRILATRLSVISAVFLLQSQAMAASELYFSEYIEGSSYNKALEIFNGTASSVDLSSYEVQFYFNGSMTPGRTINLTGMIPAGENFVLGHSSANTAILARSDQTSGGSWFNGDDAIVLMNGGVHIDAIGQIGVDPGSEWGVDLISTQDNTLRRNTSVVDGDTDAFNVFDPAIEWQGFATDSVDDLGLYVVNSGTTPPPEPTPDPVPVAQLLINELDADTTGSDTAEFIELFDGGAGNQDLTGYTLVLYNGNGDSVYAAYDLDGYQTDTAGYFVMGNAAVADVDLVIPNGKMQNGADAAVLYQADAIDFPNGSAVTTANIVDAVVYGTNDADDAGLLSLLNTGEPQLNEASQGNKDIDSSQRCSGGAQTTGGFIQALATPGQANTCGVVTSCGAPANFIHDIQGAGADSPMVSQLATVEGIVVGSFQSTTSGLSGFFVQEESADMDTDAATSEGLFINDNGLGVAVSDGDIVRVTGTVKEYFGLTELSSVTSVEVCSSGAVPLLTSVNLPFTSATSLEAYEGMLISLPQTLTVTENYNLGRYGEVVVSSGGRLYTPTNIVSPGAAAIAMQAANDLNRLVIDDGNSSQNPDLVIYPAPGLSAFNTLRSSDTVAGLTGVVSFTAGTYRVHATKVPQFVGSNPRNPAPVLPAMGSLKVASFNVLNYFNGDGQGVGFPTARGADTLTEFTRQRDKIISAITAMNADIIGLMEIENDGYSANSAIQDLVNSLNSASPAGTSYRFVNTGTNGIGTDAIAVGLIYRNETVQAVGASAILDSSVDSRFNDTKNRPTLAQTFVEKASNARLTIAVNHLKSKGSSCAAIGDPDTGDGQGNCNLTRTAAAEAMVDWLATDPTNSGDSDVLIIGDLNAYAKEDPITAILAGNYTNLISTLIGPSAYSYNFKGQSGNLDHALASATLATQVTGITDWHINADEPRVLDYNVEFKTANQVIDLYNNAPFRASDHDPVIVELNLLP